MKLVIGMWLLLAGLIDLDTRTLTPNYNVNDLFFKANSIELNESQDTIIFTFINYLKANPNISIQIQGYSDFTEKDKEKLSIERALLIKYIFIFNRIDPARLHISGVGDSKMFYSEKFIKTVPKEKQEYYKSLNRRVAIKVLKE